MQLSFNAYLMLNEIGTKSIIRRYVQSTLCSLLVELIWLCCCTDFTNKWLGALITNGQMENPIISALSSSNFQLYYILLTHFGPAQKWLIKRWIVESIFFFCCCAKMLQNLISRAHDSIYMYIYICTGHRGPSDQLLFTSRYFIPF